MVLFMLFPPFLNFRRISAYSYELTPVSFLSLINLLRKLLTYFKLELKCYGFVINESVLTHIPNMGYGRNMSANKEVSP